MDGLALWVTLVVLLGSLLSYPIVGKIRRRERTDRPDGLYIVSEPEHVVFEIVAVHGLGAHPEYTWTSAPSSATDSEDGKRVHLLRDLLKNDFLNARILAFAHNSDWLIDAPVKSAQQIGDRLLKELVKHRLQHQCVPIVFIGHSFGGIIIKEALCNPKDAALDVVDSTCGIVFLGTPHQGSPVSRLGAAAARVTGLLGSSTSLLLSLTSYREQLSDLDLRFVQCMKEKESRRQKTEIVAFCETKPTRVLGWLSAGLIVPTDSARGGHAALTVFIDTDHSGLNKCGNRNDRLYTELHRQLHRLRPTTTPTLNGNQKFVVGKLRTVEGAAFNSHANEHVATCLENTRHELLEEINQWADGPMTREHIYWLQGKAGTGKSTIARTVARDLAAQDRLAASFFFKRGESDRGTARLFFTTIAVQLVQCLPVVAEYVRNAIEADPNIAERALGDQFRKLILEPVEAVPHSVSRAMTVVIDALDECEGGQDVAAVIKLLLQKDRPVVAPLKFFVTSRFEPPIRLALHDFHGNYIEFPLHEIPIPQIKRDIEAFLKFRLEQIRDTLNMPKGWPDPAKLQDLAKQTVPLFISAVTACRFIGERRRRGGPNERLEKFLKCQTDGQSYDATYRPVMDQMLGLDRQADEELIEDFKEIVGSIITIADPLSATSLERLLEKSTDDLDRLLDYLHSVLLIPDDRTVPIRLFHQSFRDYLINPQGGANEFRVDEKATHKMLADRCLRLLSEGGYLKNDICGLRAPGKPRTIVDQQTIDRCLPSEARYACLYWVHHLKGSGVTLHDEHQALQFLQSHFLHWLEALSFMERISESISLIDELQGLVDGDHHSAVSDFLHDAKRFILKNRQIADDAPLQLYCSGLIFAPHTSIIRREFKTELPTWACQLPQVEERWSAELQTLEGHSGSVYSVAFSPDGQMLASGSDDKTVRLWDTATGALQQTLEGHLVAFSPDGRMLASGFDDETVQLWDAATGALQQTLKGHLVAFSPDGRMLASGSDDEIVRLWDATTGALQQTLEGHSGSVYSVAFSPDGRMLASGSDDETVQLWDATTGALQQTLEGHSGWVYSVAFSPDGRMLASGSSDKTVRLWDTATGALEETLEGHSGLVYSVAFSPDGRMLASRSNDNTVRLWDTATGALQQTLEGHSVAFSPDGRMLASGSSDKTVRLWDTATGALQQTLEGHSGLVYSVAFSPDGRMLASGSDDETVQLWDAATGALQQTLKGHSGLVRSVAFSPDGRMLASGSDDNTVRLWDTATGALQQTLKGHSVAFSPDGRMLASDSGLHYKTVRLWDTATGALQQTLKGYSVAFSPDGRMLASDSGFHYKIVQLWDAATGALQQTLEGHSGWVYSVAFSPDGRMLASGSDDNTVRLWDTATGALQQTLKGHLGLVYSVAFSPDGRMLASNSDDITVRLWDTATGALQQTLGDHSVAFSPDGRMLASNPGFHIEPVRLWDAATGALQQTLKGDSGSVSSVAFSPDGRMLASGSSDKTVRLWDTATGALQQTLKGHLGSVRSVAFSPDGRMLASGSDDQTVWLWDTATGALQQTLEGHSGSVGSVAFSPDGRVLASDSSSYDETVRLWDAATGALQQTLKGHSGSVRSVAFSPDGRILASAGSGDETVRLWDAATGALQQTLEGHSGSVSSVAFSPDGWILASGSGDKTVRLWDAATGALQQTLEGHSDVVYSVAFSPDGRILASAGCSDQTVRLWDAATGALQQTLRGHSHMVSSVAFSPDGRMLASSCFDETVRLWDAATGALQQTLKGYSVAFSPDGRMLASGSGDETVRLWDTATGALQQTLKGHSGSVRSVAFSPDGRMLASGSGDKTVRLWETATGALQQTLSVGGIPAFFKFSPTGSYLWMNLGSLEIQPKCYTGTPHVNLEIFIEQRQWVIMKGDRVLWLPPGSRPSCSAIHGRVLAIGHASGRVSFIGFRV